MNAPVAHLAIRARHPGRDRVAFGLRLLKGHAGLQPSGDEDAAEKLSLPDQKSNRSMFSLLKSSGGPSTISDPLMLIAPSLPASIARVPAGSF